MKGRAYHALIRQALRKHPFARQGIRKILQGLEWETNKLPPVTFKDLAYGPNKVKQLERNYWNQEEMERVKAVLARRQRKAFTSVAVSLRNKAKDSRSMGHCMLSMVISRTREITTAELHYRSTELGLKFSGDLSWIPTIVDYLGVKPAIYRFRFANCFLSGVYLPYIGRWWEDGPLAFLQEVQDLDPKFFESATRFFWRSSLQKDQYFPYSPEAVAHRYNWEHNAIALPEIRDWLAKQHKPFGKGKPEVHKNDGKYVPRGKRHTDEEDEE